MRSQMYLKVQALRQKCAALNTALRQILPTRHLLKYLGENLNITHLVLRSCKSLMHLPEQLPPGLLHLDLPDCRSLITCQSSYRQEARKDKESQ